jgi:type VI secretion system protein VasJ
VSDSDRAALGTAPVPGSAPAGASVKYDPEFEQLVAEVGKLESVDGRGSIKWNDVVELSSNILAGKSKDLLVGAYLTLGLLHEEGYAGLSVGLTATRDLLATFWENLFPEKARMRARQAAVQWMCDRVSDALTALGDASESDRDALAACDQRMGEISTFVRDNFGENLPDTANLVRLVGEKFASVPAASAPASETPAEAAPAEGSDGGSTSAAPAPAAAGPIDSPDAAREALGSLRERRLAAAVVLREAAPTDPLPYRLLREAAWEDLVEAPADGSATGGDAAFAAALEQKLAAGDYAAVAAEAEGRLPADRLWLDLSFFSYRALEGLGRPYAAAKLAVGHAVTALTRRLPGLMDLKFSDGTPLAGPAAALWIRHELSAAPAGTGRDPVDAALAEARALVARNSFGDATQLVLKRFQSLSSRRDRFRCRLALASLCLEGGRSDLAIPQLESLDEEARKLGVEEWEPDIAAELARALWTCYRGSPTPERAEAHFARLCRLDPAAAIRGNGAPAAAPPSNGNG